MIEKALLELTADLVAATMENNRISTNDVAGLIVSVHDALAKLGTSSLVETVVGRATPAVSVRSSLKPDSLTCLECGSVQKALKRHLGTSHALTPAEYRAKWSLPASYPMVAPNNSAARSAASIARGLGRKKLSLKMG
ncbi:MucR family transcriptional regulator [Sphingomonas psychrolutea]|uniref:Transcriptional regulator n=1 Tax=Sphingomonas psychrolutea TaxID=1259676 RepID=A0ABQ1H8S6_9SPHN|nr:MucR family transcriptional regulator [Sphingomonas psychrolutea]GGA62410.1 transcriptional regulator [Sphingomonas psychrolutea]